MDRATLDVMLRVSDAAPEPFRPSPFWKELGSEHLRQLERSGLATFKRTVNVRYFNWRTLGILRHQFVPVAMLWSARPTAALATARLLPPLHAPSRDAHSFGPLTSALYAAYVAMLADVLQRDDPRGFLDRLDEPLLGDPFLVRYKGRNRSQDLCNSIHEFYSALGDVDPAADVDLAEVGAGYGRLAWLALQELPQASYCVVDLPPALYVSQHYLTTLFPDRAAFRFRAFERYDEIRDEFERARLRFLLPHQTELLPARAFDRIITISTLHEMTRPQVHRYFALFDRLCRDRVYIKQWRRSRAPVNGDILRESDYPVPVHWRTVFRRRHPIQTLFFDALFAVQ
ncbi:MAG: putative sugar O-methyltransferase [Elusimicrobia bacterium]|nr:putative sugar O-methyltransferase [Elusimicrobiota bacterium]